MRNITKSIWVIAFVAVIGTTSAFAQTYKSFPNMNETNINPYAYDKDVIYVTVFEPNQWIGKSVVATTGSASDRAWGNSLRGLFYGSAGMPTPASTDNGTCIFIKDISDKYLKEINGTVEDACLKYIGAQTFQMANGSSQVFPVFQLVGFYQSASPSGTYSYTEVPSWTITFGSGTFTMFVPASISPSKRNITASGTFTVSGKTMTLTGLDKPMVFTITNPEVLTESDGSVWKKK